MRKIQFSILMVFSLISSLSLIGQKSETVHPCGTYSAMDDLFNSIPGSREAYEKKQLQLYKEYQNYSANQAKIKSASVNAAVVYTVPVVFHVLHQGGPENVADSIIIKALEYINKDFARQNFDANSTAPPFNSSYINSDIKLMLAKKDPDGNCTSGIVRHITSRTNWKKSFGISEYAYTWNPTKYLNIYIVKGIEPIGNLNGTLVGYTYKPGAFMNIGDARDAIVYNYSYLETTNSKVRSLTHEMGHWFNLAHTWGNSNDPNISCGDDGISDTPVTKGEPYGCPASNVATCTQTNPVMMNLNNVQNIMNYSDCPLNFTTEQTLAMRSALASSVSGRNNLWSASNLGSSGTDVNANTICPLTADFMSTAPNGYTLCAGQSIVNFKDFSYNGAVNSWTWTATNGATIAATNSSVTSIFFPASGLSIVTLSVQNNIGVSSMSRTVTVVSVSNVTTSISESFEGVGTPPNWKVVNQTGGVTWAQMPNVGSHGSSSFYLNGTISPGSAVDILEMPMFDFASNPNAILTFKYAYRRKDTSQYDVFKVQLSDNCGVTWKDVYAPSAAVLANGSGGLGVSVFIPTSSEWKLQDVSTHPNYQTFSSSPSVMGRFYFQESIGGFGNRLYIDEVNLGVPSGFNEFTSHLRLNLFPNPTNGSAKLTFILSNEAVIKTSIKDIAGKIVSEASEMHLNSGEHVLILNENNTLEKGIYIITIDYNGTKMARKLVVE